MVLELPRSGRGAIKDEGQLDAAKVGVEDVAVYEQVGREISFLEEELRGDLRAKNRRGLSMPVCSSDSADSAHHQMT